MPNILTPGELKTHIYEEVANEITRNDDNIIDEAIEVAIAETKGYLQKYDLIACIDAVLPNARNPKLVSVIKDIATWYLIHLCNVNIDYEKRRDLYDNAIAWLSGVQKGTIVPVLPLTPINPTTPQANQSVKYSSNPKRNNHY